jgi:holin-like protein
MDERILITLKNRRVIFFAAGCASLAFSYYLGMAISKFFGGYLSPPVAGMILLFLLLRLKIVKEEWIKEPASFFLDNLMLFFIPVTAGIALISFSSLKNDAISIVIAATISTWMVLWVAGTVAQRIDKR